MTPDPLWRGWSPTLANRHRAGLYLLVGVALVLTPVWAGPATAAIFPATTYEYHAVSIAPAGDEFDFPEDAPTREPVSRQDVDGLACEGISDSYACGVEASLVEGNVTVSEWFTARPGDDFVFVDAFYRRTWEPTGDDDVELGLLRVDAATVLAGIAVPPADLSDAGRDLLASGSVTRREPLAAAGDVVETADGYVLFTETVRTHQHDFPPAVVTLPVALLAGFASLRRGQRAYDRWQERIQP